MAIGYTLQLHVSALGIGHLQVVHNLSISYIMCVGFIMGDETSSY